MPLVLDYLMLLEEAPLVKKCDAFLHTVRQGHVLVMTMLVWGEGEDRPDERGESLADALHHVVAAPERALDHDRAAVSAASHRADQSWPRQVAISRWQV